VVKTLQDESRIATGGRAGVVYILGIAGFGPSSALDVLVGSKRGDPNNTGKRANHKPKRPETPMEFVRHYPACFLEHCVPDYSSPNDRQRIPFLA
jgi:hypothetical protein